MAEELRIHVDYNTIDNHDPKRRVYINTVVQPELLTQLYTGQLLVLYDSESLEVDAIAEFDQRLQQWWGVPNWSTRRDLPPLNG